MKIKYNKELKAKMCVPETPLEAVEQLEIFFESDIWYSKENEWKTKEDMIKYLRGYFNICKKAIKKCSKKNTGVKQE